MGGRRFNIDGIKRFTRRHKQPVAFSPTESDVRAGLRQPDHPDAITIWSDDLHTRTCTRPDVSIGIATNTVRRRRLTSPGNIKLHESFSIADGLSIDVPD